MLLKEVEEAGDKPDGPVMAYLRQKNKSWMSEGEIQKRIDERVSKGMDRLETLFREAQSQLEDMRSERSSELSLHSVSNEGDVSGTFEGNTGLLTIMQEEDCISGTYQFDGESFMGELHGTIRDGIIRFEFSWKNNEHTGSGILFVRDFGNRLDGFYWENQKLNDVDVDTAGDAGEPWSFTKLSDI